ncbi:MAG TPA: RNA polymerase sigma factor [Polyangiaceae bacterium]|nr:RNA polymerase sigma factor [Polyangiaceae bacterium]
MNPSLLQSAALEPSALELAREEDRPSGVREREREDVHPADLLALLYRQMRSLAGPRQDLDDLVQQAAERALRALDRFEGRCALSTFTYGIVYRTMLDHDRWFRRFRRRFAIDQRDDSPEPSSPRCSEMDMVELERARRLYQALDNLPAAKRAVLILHDLEGIDVADVSNIVGANERTVRSRVRDARKKLAELLKADPLFDPGVP